jgi:hypothetical protein
VGNKTKQNPKDDERGNSSGLATLTRQYLVVYAIVMGSLHVIIHSGRSMLIIFLQGPIGYRAHMCILYIENSTLSRRGWLQFSSSQVSSLQDWQLLWWVYGRTNSTLTGDLEYIHFTHNLYRSGRRRLCLVFCLTYTLACACITIPSVPTLLLGRVLGGTSTSILFSAFESWLISASTSAGLPSADLSTIMGRATVINGLVATGAGVVSNKLVAATNDFKAPFVASAIFLMLAWFVIRETWVENYGSGGGVVDHDVFQIKRLGRAWNIVRRGMSQVIYLSRLS